MHLAERNMKDVWPTGISYLNNSEIMLDQLIYLFNNLAAFHSSHQNWDKASYSF